MQDKSLMFYMIRSELEDAVGVENVSTKEIERAAEDQSVPPVCRLK